MTTNDVEQLLRKKSMDRLKTIQSQRSENSSNFGRSAQLSHEVDEMRKGLSADGISIGDQEIEEWHTPRVMREYSPQHR